VGDDKRAAPRVSPKQPLPSLDKWGPELARSLLKPWQTVGSITGSALGRAAEGLRTPPPKALSALGSIANPGDAPASITVDAHLHRNFSKLMDEHLQEGSHERGGTLVWSHQHPGLYLVNDGRTRLGNTFVTDLQINGYHELKGGFHTHLDTNTGDIDPRTNPKGLIATSFGGADMAWIINNKLDVNVLYTGGDKDFMLLRTGATPSSVDHDQLKAEYMAEHTALEEGSRRQNAAEASQALNHKYAKKLGFALYEGKNGNFERVEPPP